MRKPLFGLFASLILAAPLALVSSAALAAGVGDVSSAMRYGASAPLGSIITNLSGEDDDTDSFQAAFPVNFFGTVYGGLCVTTNGGIFLTEDTDGSGGAADGDWTNESCSDNFDMDLENLALDAESPLIAAMGNDQDLGACDDNSNDGFGVQCEMYYGTTTVDGRDAYAVTWYRVPQFDDYNDSALSNTFQIVIIKAAGWNGTTNWDFDIEFNFGQVKDVEDADGYDVDDPSEECNDAETNCRWAIGWVDYSAGPPETTDVYELFPNTPSAQLADGGVASLTANSLNSAVAGRYFFGQRGGVTSGFSVPVMDGSASSSGVGDVSSAMRYGASAPLGSIITNLSGEDDDTDSFQAAFPVNFFGTVYGGLCVTTNGGIFLTEDTDGSGGAADGDWTNESCSDNFDMDLENLALDAESPLIAAMGNDQDLGACDDNSNDGFGVQCEMYYGTTTVDGRDAYAVTWYRVPQFDDYNDSALSNTFQIVIIKAAGWNGTTNWDFDIEFNFGQVKDVEDADGYDVDDPSEECNDAETNCRWAIGWVDYSAGPPETTDVYELFPNTPSAQLADGGVASLTANSLNSAVAGRYFFGQRGGVTSGFSVPVMDGSGPRLNSSSSSSSTPDPGVPGIYMAVAGPVGRSVMDSPLYYGSDRVAASSTYRLTVTAAPRARVTPLTLAEGELPLDGSLLAMVRLPALAPGTYNVRLQGQHRNGSTLQLTSVITVGAEGEFTSIGPNVPVIK
jgi:CRISPR/Cas system-associated endoribonuclease Cas2